MSPQAAHWGRRPTACLRMSKVPQLETMRCVVSAETPSALRNVRRCSAASSIVVATVAGIAARASANGPLRPCFSIRFSTSRLARNRSARHCQHAVRRGTKIGPSHANAPSGLTSIQGRPARRCSSLTASSSGRR